MSAKFDEMPQVFVGNNNDDIFGKHRLGIPEFEVAIIQSKNCSEIELD